VLKIEQTNLFTGNKLCSTQVDTITLFAEDLGDGGGGGGGGGGGVAKPVFKKKF
jgi:hypothetical protein